MEEGTKEIMSEEENSMAEEKKDIKAEHSFLKYAVKLVQDAFSQLGASVATDSLLKAVLHSYAALNPSRRNRNNRRHYNDHSRNFNNYHCNRYMSNGKPSPPT